MAAGEHMQRAIAAQPDWLRRVPRDRRLPAGEVVHTGCGTSFHAAQTGGRAVQALDAAADPPRADVLVALSHEGESALTLAAVRAFEGERWVVTAAPGSPIATACDVVVVAAPEVERSWCHTASYTAAVATLCVLRGEEPDDLPGLVEGALARPRLPVSAHERFLVAGSGRDWPTAQEAVLKLREGAHVAAEAHHTEQLLHGHLAAVDETVRCFVLEGDGLHGERARGAAAALEALGCDVALLPARHPVADVVPFQLLTLDLARARGIDPDRIRRDDERWERARAAYE
jgi:glucosamine--fructose-6-phosphate aminotransferase (isomerizing)